MPHRVQHEQISYADGPHGRYQLLRAVLTALASLPTPALLRRIQLKWTSACLGIFLGRTSWLSRDPSLATWVALNQWVSEGIPFAGEAFRQMIHDLVQRNLLVMGEFRLRGRLVGLKDITCPLLSIAGTQDVICRVPQAEAIMGLAGSQGKEFCVLHGGHIGMLAGAEARYGLWRKVHRWLEARSQ